MSEARNRQITMLLLGAAGLLGLLAVVVALGSGRDSIERARALEQRGSAEQAFRLASATLETFMERISAVAVEGSVRPDERKDEEVDQGAMLRVTAAVNAQSAPAGAAAAIYEELGEDAEDEPFRLLGSVGAAGETPDGAVPPPERLPTALLWDELDRSENAGGPAPLTWFQPSKEGGGVRLHKAAMFLHEYGGEPEKDEEDTLILRLVHVSAPFAAPPGLTLDVACDLVGVTRRQDLPLHRARDEGAQDVRTASIDALVPGRHPRVRFPSASARPRASVRFEPVSAPVLPWLLVVAMLGCLGGAIWLFLRSGTNPETAAE